MTKAKTEDSEVVSYGRQDITEIMTAFHNHWGTPPKPEYRQRQYCKHLLDIFKDRTMDVVTYALSIQSDYYAPQITSPKDLYYKHLKVMDYYRRNEGDSGKVVQL